MEKEKITIYTTSEFFGSIVSYEGYLVEYGARKYAQYENAPFVKFIPKGKRKTCIIQKAYKPYLLILKGWDNPKSEGMFKKSEDKNGVTIKESKYKSYDDRYKSDFDNIINDYRDLFLADYRV